MDETLMPASERLVIARKTDRRTPEEKREWSSACSIRTPAEKMR